MSTTPPTARCPSCGWINVGRVTGCLNCATPLPQRPNEPATIACSACGAAVPAGNAFCLSCGTAVAPVAAAQPSQPPAWWPTHLIPRGGLDAWAAPDPSSQLVTTLGARTEVQVVETLGPWARVMVQNGWSGWVDGRSLKERR